MPLPPQHKQYTITICLANGHATTHHISATLPQAVQWARSIASGCLQPAAVTITTTGGAVVWTETISHP